MPATLLNKELYLRFFCAFCESSSSCLSSENMTLVFLLLNFNRYFLTGIYHFIKILWTWLCLVGAVVVRRCSVKKVFLKISQNFKETLTQVLSCEFFEMFKNTFFIEQFWWLLLRLLKEKDRFKVMKKT